MITFLGEVVLRLAVGCNERVTIYSDGWVFLDQGDPGRGSVVLGGELGRRLYWGREEGCSGGERKGVLGEGGEEDAAVVKGGGCFIAEVRVER